MTNKQLDEIEKDAAHRNEAQVLMLVKALREAWAAARHAQVDADVEVERCTVERDEARAEVERLKVALRRMIDDDCWYGDGCITDKRCHPCEARHALGIPYDEQKFEKLRWTRHERRQAVQEEEQ